MNSVRIRLPHLTSWLCSEQPDLLALQETKVVDAQFPREELEETGYRVLISGQAGYNGVAILSRYPPESWEVGIAGYSDPQCRVIAASYRAPNLPGGQLRLINIYTPSGQEVGCDKYHYKLAWLEQLLQWIAGELCIYPSLALLGDYNISPEDRDVYDPVLWKGRITTSPPERAAFQALLSMGFQDAVRMFHTGTGVFSWWDYRTNALSRNRGLLIDHILLSKPLAKHCQNSWVDTVPRHWTRPSDHTPVLAELL